ncbi:G-protein coupled receptor moody isoform X1 [Bombus vosnesenskii]|uniref:G-protein coupled receptor moody isoform X1 n=2 Tax=Pyrobombus TaxID=144703 RepID=A0A6J3KI05_9HYME|nr:G-protein coupled receptor moody isoform X1 [Bombus vancouverensis nearcticus]XP_033193217.1 G-protein coupled receptor moody isoform X1 [Bombus vancouverensis nearcticus]XP_033307560.1 G-protein coupled receptor moody isoform X1 [Bombus bifarius]XP_033307561.1 G-protein coupled receptor moody isoform X1 [Bombus bifarius]XP_033351533.1 G-protein coupled receptor moody isoform X1 [Bombus vosnesenskii]XP_033351534.1 G-protein coupled receptor moody isoform X1 [Bombus vosnesenskii]XP_05047646
MNRRKPDEIPFKMDNLATWLLRASENNTESAIIDGEVSRFPKPLQTFAAVVAILIMITGLAGNLLTIIALCKYPKVRNVAAAFIISLCVADFVFCLLVLPFDSIRFIDASWVNIRFLCVLVPFLRYGNVGVSLLSVAAITINRYIMIAHHGLYSKVYKKYWIAFMIVFCWLFSYGMQVPTLLGIWGRIDYDPNLETCSIVKDSKGYSSKTFLFVVGFVIPCVIIVGCYTKIFWVVHRSETRMRKHASPTIKSPHTPGRDTREIKQRRSEWRITKMVLAIFLSFVACYLPITIVKVSDAEVRYPEFHILGYLLLYFASCVNPIIYVIMNKQYRQAYAGVIGCSRIRASLSPYGSSAPGHHQQQDYGQDYSKDFSKTMVSTVSIAMNPVRNSRFEE